MDSLEVGNEVYINGPHGNWKYLESPGIFHYKPHNCIYEFKRIQMIVENDNYLSCIGIIRNEISKENINSSVEIRILYIADSLENILDRERQEFLCQYKVGRVKFVCSTKIPNCYLLDSSNSMLKMGNLVIDDIYGISPLPNSESLVIVGVSNEKKLFVQDSQKTIGFREWQIINN